MTTEVTSPEGLPPISVAQEAMWYAARLAPNQLSYNETLSIRKDGPFDIAAFRRAFEELVRRHEAWRTTFDVVGGEPVQIIHPSPRLDLPVLDLSGLTLPAAERHAVRVASEMSRVPYNLRLGPLLRPRLIRFSDHHHRLYLAMHHLIFDGVSIYRVILPELIAVYDAFVQGKSSPLSELTTHYADYARWEQEWISSPRVTRRMEHWRRRLHPTPMLSLPLDRRRSPNPQFRGAVAPVAVPQETVARLREIGHSVGASLFQVLATGWALLLSRYSGQDDVAIATVTDLRQRPEFESLVGCSISPLVLRVDMGGGGSFDDLVLRVRNELLDALDNFVPFERLVRELAPVAPDGANPIYQAMIVLEPPSVAPDPNWSTHLMESEIGDAVGGTRLDLELQLDERPDGQLAGRLLYDRDLFEAATATTMVEHWRRLLDAVAGDPSGPVSGLLAAGPDDQDRLADWNATATLRPMTSVYELIRAHAERDAAAPALVAGGEVLTYGQLCSQAERTARRLQVAGLGRGDVVAFCSEPTAELVTSILGVLRAGATYLLLDPERSRADLDFMVSDSGAAAVYADPGLAARLTGQSTPILSLAQPGNGSDDGISGPDQDRATLCCVQYATTTAKRPPRVPMGNDAVANLATAVADELGLGDADTALVFPESLFRASVVDLWVPFAAGAKVVLAPRGLIADGVQASRTISAERVSYVHATPEIWRGLIESGLKASRGLVALSGGQELDGDLADALLDRARLVFNAYGTVETTVYATLARVERSRPIRIGRPLANTRAHVLDGHRRPVPVGVAGALVIAGGSVTQGCGNRAAKGRRGFVDDPDGSGVAFATGDTARWCADGQLELLSVGMQ